MTHKWIIPKHKHKQQANLNRISCFFNCNLPQDNSIDLNSMHDSCKNKIIKNNWKWICSTWVLTNQMETKRICWNYKHNSFNMHNASVQVKRINNKLQLEITKKKKRKLKTHHHAPTLRLPMAFSSIAFATSQTHKRTLHINTSCQTRQTSKWITERRLQAKQKFESWNSCRAVCVPTAVGAQSNIVWKGTTLRAGPSLQAT